MGRKHEGKDNNSEYKHPPAKNKTKQNFLMPNLTTYKVKIQMANWGKYLQYM